MQAHLHIIFYHSTVESTVKRVTWHIYLDFVLVGDLGFEMMSTLKLPKHLKFNW